MTSVGCSMEMETRQFMNNIGDPELIRRELEFMDRSDVLIAELQEKGLAWANAEHAYKCEKSQTALALRAKGMNATLISSVLEGYGEVASKRLARDIAEAEYDATKEAINMLKMQIRVIEAQITREWGQAQ